MQRRKTKRKMIYKKTERLIERKKKKLEVTEMDIERDVDMTEITKFKDACK
jgi:hypothetical protein